MRLETANLSAEIVAHAVATLLDVPTFADRAAAIAAKIAAKPGADVALAEIEQLA